MTRDQFHDAIDEQLNALGFTDRIEVKWGSIVLQVNFENGKEVLRIKERETEKVFDPKH